MLVGLVSTSLQAIGLTLQRKSHILEDEKDPYDIRRPPYKRRRWQVCDKAIIWDGWVLTSAAGHAHVRGIEYRRKYDSNHHSPVAGSLDSSSCKCLPSLLGSLF